MQKESLIHRCTVALLIVSASICSAQSAPTIAVAAQYDTTNVYVTPENVVAFVKAFLGTFGGTGTKQVVATVTPTQSSTCASPKLHPA